MYVGYVSYLTVWVYAKTDNTVVLYAVTISCITSHCGAI
jgi:hypothetical protein